jgi:hypothetical protein
MTFCEYTDFLDSFGDFDEKNQEMAYRTLSKKRVVKTYIFKH